MNKTIFYIVRHARSESNTQGFVAGHTDVKLTPEGEKQAASRAQEFKNLKFDKVFSSDLIRAKRTAEIIALEHNLAIETTKLLRERNFGTYQGKKPKAEQEKIQEMLEEFSKMEKNKRWKLKLNESMETDEELVSRFLTFLRETAIAYPNQSILIVSHNGPMKSLLLHLGYLESKEIEGFANTGYIKLESDGIEFFIKETKGLFLKEE